MSPHQQFGSFGKITPFPSRGHRVRSGKRQGAGPDAESQGPSVRHCQLQRCYIRSQWEVICSDAPFRLKQLSYYPWASLWWVPHAPKIIGVCRSRAGDEVGAANILTPHLAQEAAKLVKTGKTYPLAIETSSRSAAFGPRSWSLTIVQPGQNGGATLGPNKGTYNDDIINGWVGIGLQIDGRGHFGIDNIYYNCNRSVDLRR